MGRITTEAWVIHAGGPNAAPGELIKEAFSFPDITEREDDRSAGAMRAWLADNPQHKGGKHSYSLEQFHLDPEAVDRLFQPYTERFIERAPDQ